MLIAIVFFFQVLPGQESMIYRTNDKGKIGTMSVTVEKDSLGYNVVYTWEDRILEVIFDTTDMSTIYVKKVVAEKVELEASREKKFKVFFKGNHYNYNLGKPIYDRHAIEFALRDFNYHNDFERTIRFHVPEFMVVNAKIKVLGEENLSVPIGEFLCWKVEMSIKVLLVSWKSFFWIEKEYPHRFIRFQDASGEHDITINGYSQKTE